MTTPTESRTVALLIGIDGYSGQPLSGCVNDIERVAAFLQDKLGVAPTSIRKMLAPADGASAQSHDESWPTYDNVVAALRNLASPDMRRGDRVFIYYSGHGSYEEIPLVDSYFEGIVPIDHEEKGLLYDVEMNGLLQAVAKRTGDLTVVLDCCHSAGTTRAGSGQSDDLHIRFAPVRRSSPRRDSEIQQRIRSLEAATRDGGMAEEYTVVAASHADEPAAECRTPPKHGKFHGLFTHLLFDLLGRVEDDALARLRWSDIWEHLKAAMHRARPDQRPAILGPPERPIFGGPWTRQDAGFRIRKNLDGSYQIGAGTLAGLGPGAVVAVYGPSPDRFPSLHSEEDTQARAGILTVETAQLAEAVGYPSPVGAAFDLPENPRARLIKPGAPALLRVAIEPSVSPRLRELLLERASWHSYEVCAADDGDAEVRVGQYEDGDLYVGDDLCGPGPPHDSGAPGPMARVSRCENTDLADVATKLGAGLEHYAQYVIPLRIVRSGGFTLPETAIGVKLLACKDPESNRRMERDATLRHEVRRNLSNHRYLVHNNAEIAIHLQNRSSYALYVSLLLCSLEGQIELIDEDVCLRSGSGKIFWHGNIVGEAFNLVAPTGYDWGIDRLIVIATDQKGISLAGLEQKHTLSEAMDNAVGAKSLSKKVVKSPPIVRWTAVQTLIQIGEPEPVANFLDAAEQQRW